MIIVVLREDIMGGNYCDSLRCPLALALIRKYPDKFISVGPKDVTIGIDNYRIDGISEDYLYYHVGANRSDTRDLSVILTKTT